MASEDLLFHGKHTESGKRILEYPTYHIAQSGRHWNVLCRIFGDSGYLETKAEAEEWVRKHIASYVKLEDYLVLEKENARLKAELTKLQIDPIQHTGD